MRFGMIGLVAAMLTVGGVAQASEHCGGRNINNFVVGSVSFDRQGIQQAIGRLLVGTPYRVDVQPGLKKFLTAKNVSGPLGGILRKISTQTGLEITREGCRIVVYDPDSEKQSWSISDPGEDEDMVGEINVYMGSIDVHSN